MNRDRSDASGLAITLLLKKLEALQASEGMRALEDMYQVLEEIRFSNAVVPVSKVLDLEDLEEFDQEEIGRLLGKVAALITGVGQNLADIICLSPDGRNIHVGEVAVDKAVNGEVPRRLLGNTGHQGDSDGK